MSEVIVIGRILRGRRTRAAGGLFYDTSLISSVAILQWFLVRSSTLEPKSKALSTSRSVMSQYPACIPATATARTRHEAARSQLDGTVRVEAALLDEGQAAAARSK